MKNKKHIFLRLLPTIFIFLWVIGFCWEMVMYFFPNSILLFPILKYNYSLVCHCESDKLFSIFDLNSLICSRCTGIYIGSLISAFLIFLNKNISISTKVLFVCSIPLFIDVISTSINFYEYSKFLAFSTGFLLGSIGFIYIHKEVFHLLKNFKAKSWKNIYLP